MTTIKLKNGSTAQWAQHNDVLKVGEPGFDRDTRTLKVGDGSTPWSALPSLNASGTPANVDGGSFGTPTTITIDGGTF